MKKALIASTSTLHGGNYLDYLVPELTTLFKNCSTLLFLPYAQPGGISYETYTKKVAAFFSQIGIQVQGIHEFDDPKKAVAAAESIFVGGGNTFLLVSQLYANDLMTLLTTTVKDGTPYLGTSAGSNITGLSMQTTNDMPIVYPPSFKTLGLLSFNVNPHFLDPDLNSKHMGETRETRINEFHAFNTVPVLGLREGSWLAVNGNQVTLGGTLTARLFKQNETPIEIQPGFDLSELK